MHIALRIAIFSIISLTSLQTTIDAEASVVVLMSCKQALELVERREADAPAALEKNLIPRSPLKVSAMFPRKAAEIRLVELEREISRGHRSLEREPELAAVISEAILLQRDRGLVHVPFFVDRVLSTNLTRKIRARFISDLASRSEKLRKALVAELLYRALTPSAIPSQQTIAMEVFVRLDPELLKFEDLNELVQLIIRSGAKNSKTAEAVVQIFFQFALGEVSLENLKRPTAQLIPNSVIELLSDGKISPLPAGLRFNLTEFFNEKIGEDSIWSDYAIILAILFSSGVGPDALLFKKKLEALVIKESPTIHNWISTVLALSINRGFISSAPDVFLDIALSGGVTPSIRARAVRLLCDSYRANQRSSRRTFWARVGELKTHPSVLRMSSDLREALNNLGRQ